MLLSNFFSNDNDDDEEDAKRDSAHAPLLRLIDKITWKQSGILLAAERTILFAVKGARGGYNLLLLRRVER